ncbi:helix-turn-helix domain-containing protein [Paenibacillus chitinolyticus]
MYISTIYWIKHQRNIYFKFSNNWNWGSGMLYLYGVYFDDFIPMWYSTEATLNCHLAVIVTQGKVIYTLNGQPNKAEAGEVLIIPKGTKRSAENDESGPHQKFTVLFDYEATGSMYIPILERDEVLKMHIRSFDYLISRCLQLYYGFKEEGEINRLLCLNQLHEIMLLISKEAEMEGASPTKMMLAKKMQKYLVERYRQHVEISDLAKLINRSPNYTSSLFKEVTGQSPMQFVARLRLLEARRLLLQSDMTVSEIAQYLGFYDTSHFFRLFRKAMSITPSEFRARNILED